VVYEDPPAPTEVDPRLSPRVEKVILKSLAKVPEARFQSGAQLSAALRRAAVSKPRPKAKPREGAKPARRRRRCPVVRILGLTAFLLLMLLGLLFILAGGAELVRLRGTSSSTQPSQPSTVAVAASTGSPSASGIPPESANDGIQEPEPSALVTAAESTSVTDAPAAEPSEVGGAHADLPPGAPNPFFGRMAFTSNRDGNPEIYVVGLAGGKPTRLTRNSADDWLPDWTPDGSKIAFTSSRGGGYDLWAMTASGADATAKVATAAWDDYARWAPDGRRLAFSSTGESQGVANSEIFVWSPGGGLARLTDSTAEDQWPDWSPAGRVIYCEGWKGTGNWDIWVVDSDGSNRGVWLGGSTVDIQATWSPDGKRVAFLRISQDTNANGQLDEEDRGDIWMADENASSLRQLTSGRWASNPAWSPDRKWVAFVLQRDSNDSGSSDAGDVSDILAVRVVDGELVPLVTSPYQDYSPAWTR
jgi:TolB protein